MTNSISETARYRAQTVSFCNGVGVDIGSGGDPVVPWAVNFDLPLTSFNAYRSNVPAFGPIQLRGFCDKLPFESDSLDFVYSSHLLEDFPNWTPILQEWVRVLKPGGNLVILIPDKVLWVQAVCNGQPPNDAHRHEGEVGELSSYAAPLNLRVIADQLTESFPGDYSILFVAQKLAGA